MNLTTNIIDSASFYNEIRNELKFPKQLIYDKLMDKYLDDQLKYISTFNIYVCGRPGAGKRTFINRLIKSISYKAVGGESSSRILKYIHPTFPISLYETPEIDSEYKIMKITDLISKRKQLEEPINRIHAVFYLVSGIDARFFMSFEGQFIKYILEKIEIPIYFLITKLNMNMNILYNF